MTEFRPTSTKCVCAKNRDMTADYIPCPMHDEPTVPDPTVEALSEAELDALQVAAGEALFSDDPIPAAVERILAARAAAPDALRVAVEALAAEVEATDPVEWALAGQDAGLVFVARLRALLDDPALAGRPTGGEG